MRAMELAAFQAGGLKLAQRPDPRPGPAEALIRIRAAALNFRDVEIAQGRYGMPVRLPVVPLSDAVGEVVELGPGVTEFAVGDVVNPAFFVDWIDGEFRGEYFARQWGAGMDGMLREFAVVPVSALVRAPAHLRDEAAALPVAALTAWSALTEAELHPGQTVLVIGTGGVSLFALQFARMFGLRAIVVSSSDEKLARAMELGARAGVNHRETPQWGARVQELTDGRGVDLVVETGGAQTLPQSIQALRTGGNVAVVGYVTGAEARFDLRTLFIGKRARVQGHTVGSRRRFEAMNRAIELHWLVPVVDSRHAMEDAHAAYERMASGQAFGKVLIVP